MGLCFPGYTLFVWPLVKPLANVIDQCLFGIQVFQTKKVQNQRKEESMSFAFLVRSVFETMERKIRVHLKT